LRAYKKEWYRRRVGHPIRQHSWHGMTGSPEYWLLVHAKDRARRKGLAFNLDLVDIIIPRVCPVLGIVLRKAKKQCDDHSPSLDRIIPALGYIKGNVRVISYRANVLKNNATLEEFLLVVKDVLKCQLQQSPCKAR
jgi:hypothetical protein